MSVVGQVLAVVRSRAGRVDLPGVAMVALLTTTVLAGCLTGGPGPADPAASPGSAADLDALRRGTLPQLLDAVPAMPEDLAGVVGHVLPDGLERLALPEPPADEPMLAALAAYAGAQGVPTPPMDVLRPAVDALRLDDEAEQALAMLLLSYVQALDLQRRATEDLTAADMAVLEQVDPADPVALEAALSKVDRDLMLQGADLLARAAEAAKDPLAVPPLTAEEVAARRAATEAEAEGVGVDPASMPASESASARDEELRSAWDGLEALLAHLDEDGTLAQPEDALSLAEAMGALADVYGAPVPADLPVLPPSLDHAVASLVHAQALAATGDGSVQDVRRLVAAARAAEPTLRAWAAWMELADLPMESGPDTEAFFTEALAPAPGPAALVAASRSGPAPTPVPTPALSGLLLSSGMDAASATGTEEALGPQVSQGLAQLLAAATHLQGVRDAAFSELPPEQQLAMHAHGDILDLMDKPTWSEDEAAAVQTLAEALAALSESGGLEAIQRAQEDALATVEEAAHALTEALPSLQMPASHNGDPLPHTPGMPNMDDVLSGTRPSCALPTGTQLCQNDILFDQVVQGYRVIVTGFGSSELDPAALGGEPDIHIDLGGSDVYRTAMGAASTNRYTVANWFLFLVDTAGITQYIANQPLQTTLAVSIDLAGDDRYLAENNLAQGSGSGVSALGVLWDVAGDDHYMHRGTGVAFGQGAGSRSGVGVLVDLGGDDVYESTGGGYAQGVGHINAGALAGDGATTTSAAIRVPGSTGILLDLGAGDDRFTAMRGQAHAAGPGSSSLLLDQEGDTTYRTHVTSPSWQGGRQEAESVSFQINSGTGGGVTALVDLGGSEDRFIGTTAFSKEFKTLPEDAPRRAGDTVWVDSASPLTFGIDSSLRDEDGDGWPSLAELAAGTDPQDSGDTPDASESLVSLVEELIAGGPEALIADSDNDGFSDVLEEQVGSDPNNETETPAHAVPSFADQSLCPATAPCTGSELQCDPTVARNDPCISLLALGMAQNNVHDHPAVVSIDLIGDDVYTDTVGGRISTATSPISVTDPVLGNTVTVQGTTVNTGSMHIDLQGNDLYEMPGVAETLGHAPLSSVSLFLEMQGNDRYSSNGWSQGYGNGTAVFADLQGGDVYTFSTQGVDNGGQGIFFEAGGRDEYRSIDVANHNVSQAAIASMSDEVFSSQGNGTDGFFIDMGEDVDAYWVPLPNGTMVDVSGIKNDVVLNRKTAGGAFYDGLHAAYQDRDGDHAVGLVEALGDTHSGNKDDERPFYTFFGGDTSGLDDSRPILDSSWLLGVPGLVIGGRGDTTYNRPANFLVDLGGSDMYASPTTASAANGVSLLLDVLPNDVTNELDQYLPTCTTPTMRLNVPIQTTTLQCPSLGAATAGIAVLADGGGQNLFHTNVSLQQTYTQWNNVVTVRGLTQGAGAAGGVGILATWDAQNEFLAEVAAHVDKRSSQATVTVRVEGIAQGAGSTLGGLTQGVGILASLGESSDMYHIDTHVTALNVTAGQITQAAVGQGATLGAPAAPAPPPLPQGTTQQQIAWANCLVGWANGGGCAWQAPGRSTGNQWPAEGIGFLLDQGGDNVFHAPAGWSQGSGTGGILWSGTSDDTYVGGPVSQAAFGALLDMGGNEHYFLRPPADGEQVAPPATCTGVCVARATADSQGAGAGGLLLDVQGDDIHDATGWDHVQGASGGALVDLGGSDVYLAHDRAQAHEGVLFELSGWDHYHLAMDGDAQGQGYGPNGTFLDAGGRDRYDYDRTATSPLFVVLQEIAKANNTLQKLLSDLEGQAESGSQAAEPVLEQIRDGVGTLNETVQGQDLSGMFDETRPDTGDAGAEQQLDQASANIDEQETLLKQTIEGLDTLVHETIEGGSDVWMDEVATALAAIGETVAEIQRMAEEAVEEHLPPVHDNGGAWEQEGGYGVDATDLVTAIVALDVMENPGTVGLEVRTEDDEVVGPEDASNGTLHLFADVTWSNANIQTDRVTFLRDNSVMGHGVPVERDGSTYYHLAWETDNQTARVADGLYNLTAAAFPAVEGDSTLDLPASHSGDFEVKVDNPPLLEADLSASAFSPAPDMPHLSLLATLSEDAPPEDPLPGAAANCDRLGAFVDVVGTNLQRNTSWTFLSQKYLCGGQPLRTDLQCPRPTDSDCLDGWYNITINATDFSDQTNSTNRTVLVDSHAPRTRIFTLAGAGYANVDDRSGGILEVHVERSDDDPEQPLGAGNVSGIQRTLIAKLSDDDPPKLGYTMLATDLGRTTLPVTLAEGETEVRLVAVSVDGVGNEESPCQSNEDRYESNKIINETIGLCYLDYWNKFISSGEDSNAYPGAVVLTVDFDPPSVTDPSVGQAYVQPGVPIRFSANVEEVGAGIDTVTIQIQDENPIAMADAGDGAFAFDDWHKTNALPGSPYLGKETEYFFTVTARDKAGNTKGIPLSGNVIDDLAPRVEWVETRYTDLDGSRMEQGRPGTHAQLVARITDINPNAVARMDVVGLSDILQNDTYPSTPCESGIDSDFTLWGCDIFLEDSFPVGAHEVLVRVEDKAGNVNDTATLSLVVDDEAVVISDLDVTEVTHDGFTVNWTTSAPAVSRLRYGQTLSVERGTPLSDDHATQHSVQVRGLAPSTTYFFQAVSVSRSGVETRSVVGGERSVETLNAFTVTLPGLHGGEILQGLVELDIDVGLFSGNQGVELRVGIQDASGQTTPRPLTQVRSAEPTAVSIETRTIPDGAYRFVVDASRGTDRLRIRSPSFTIDNTPPALSPLEPMADAVTAETTPPLRITVADAGGLLEDVRILVDGSPVASTWVVEEAIGLQGGVVAITLDAPLADGPHAVEARVTDVAGNTGSVTWDFHVDTQAPNMAEGRVVRYDPGPLAARPGATVQIQVNATDISGVAAVMVDGRALGASTTLLVPDGLDTWTGHIAVPLEATGGSHDLAVLGADHIGNKAPIGTVSVLVDRTAPSLLGADASSSNATTADVRVRVSEPASVRVVADGRMFVSDGLATVHLVNVSGLRPDTLYSMQVEATDGAGITSAAAVSHRTPPDVGPPTAPAQLLANASEEGVVLLSWQPATDDSGIDAYLVTRTVGDVSQTLPPVRGNKTALRDTLPRPVPDEVSYHVRAVDMANQTGPKVTVQARVLSLPHLVDATLTPERGTTDEPFAAGVQYWSPDGRPADRVELVLGDHRFPLTRVDPDGDCLQACLYVADVHLPATGLVETSPPVYVATSGDHNTEMALGWTPVVRSGADGTFVRGEQEVPGPAAPFILLLLAALALLSHRRRRP